MKCWTVFACAALLAAAGVRAENVWTLGAYRPKAGWPLTSPDGSVTVLLDGGAKEDFASASVRLAKCIETNAPGGCVIDMRGMSVRRGETVTAVKDVSIGKQFLCGDGRVSAFFADKVSSVGVRAFHSSGALDIRIECLPTLVRFPDGMANNAGAAGVFTKCANLTNIEIRAAGLVSIGNANVANLPALRRIAIDAPRLESLGASRATFTALTALETVELNTPALREVGESWPPFNASHRLREVVWRSDPPSLGIVKRVLNGVAPVSNVAEAGKKCVLRVPAGNEAWKALASEYEGREAEFAPPGCLGVVFASSRKAWMVEEGVKGAD